MFRYEFDENRRRVTALAENDVEAGKIFFKPYPGYWSLDHTYTDPKFRGKGIAGEMVEKIIAEARARGLKIKPVCPYAVRYMEGKDEFADVLWAGDDAEVSS